MKVADGIKVANQLTLRWQDSPGLARQTQCNHKGPYNWKREAEERALKGGSWGRTPPAISGLEDGGRGS